MTSEFDKLADLAFCDIESKLRSAKERTMGANGAVKAISRSFGMPALRSGPSRGDACKGAFRPISTVTALSALSALRRLQPSA